MGRNSKYNYTAEELINDDNNNKEEVKVYLKKYNYIFNRKIIEEDEELIYNPEEVSNIIIFIYSLDPTKGIFYYIYNYRKYNKAFKGRKVFIFYIILNIYNGRKKLKPRTDTKLISETSSSLTFKNSNIIKIRLILLLNNKYIKRNSYYKINIKIGTEINAIYVDFKYLIIIIDRRFFEKY